MEAAGHIEQLIALSCMELQSPCPMRLDVGRLGVAAEFSKSGKVSQRFTRLIVVHT
jgi:hypothetical protein